MDLWFLVGATRWTRAKSILAEPSLQELVIAAHGLNRKGEHRMDPQLHGQQQRRHHNTRSPHEGAIEEKALITCRGATCLPRQGQHWSAEAGKAWKSRLRCPKVKFLIVLARTMVPEYCDVGPYTRDGASMTKSKAGVYTSLSLDGKRTTGEAHRTEAVSLEIL